MKEEPSACGFAQEHSRAQGARHMDAQRSLTREATGPTFAMDVMGEHG